MHILFILNDPPYGTERCYNGLRLAHALRKQDPDVRLTIFLMGDAAVCAKAGQKTPEGFYSLERMLRRVSGGDNRVLVCGTCMDARGMADGELMEGAERSDMPTLAAATLDADKVLVF